MRWFTMANVWKIFKNYFLKNIWFALHPKFYYLHSYTKGNTACKSTWELGWGSNCRWLHPLTYQFFLRWSQVSNTCIYMAFVMEISLASWHPLLFYYSLFPHHNVRVHWQHLGMNPLKIFQYRRTPSFNESEGVTSLLWGYLPLVHMPSFARTMRTKQDYSQIISKSDHFTYILRRLHHVLSRAL